MGVRYSCVVMYLHWERFHVWVEDMTPDPPDAVAVQVVDAGVKELFPPYLLQHVWAAQ